MKPMYSYPRRWTLLLRGVPLLVVAAVAARSVVVWAQALLALVERWRPLPLSDGWRLGGDPLVAALSAGATLGLAAALAWLVMSLLPPLSLTEEGLYVFLPRRPRFVPWAQVSGFYATRVGGAAQPLLMVQTAGGAPWGSRLHGLAVGAGAVPGILVGAALDEFGPVMAYVLRALEAQRGAAEVRFDEQPAPPLLATAATPRAHIAALWPDAKRQPTEAVAPDRAALVQAGRLAGMVALALPLALLLHGLTQLEWRWSAAFLLALGLVEWLLASYWLVALGDLLTEQPPAWGEMLAIYPQTQVGRWWVALALLALALLGLPRWVLLGVVAGGLAWSGWLLSLLTQRLYDTSPARSWLGSAVPLVVQALLYGLLLYLMG